MGIHWFLFVAVLVAGVQGWLFNRFGQRGLRYERYFSVRSCLPGEQIEMVERISNRKLLPVPWLRLESLIHANLKFERQFNLDISDGVMFQNHRSFFSLMPYMQITRRHHITCLKRGCYRLSTATLTSGDMLGLNRSSQQLTLGGELLVYPQPATLEGIDLPSHSWQGDVTVRRWIVDDPFMISGTREYRWGDPLKGINWKATARSGRLQVHQHDYTAEHRLLIYFNVEDHEKMWSQVNNVPLMEKGIAYAAAFAQLGIERGMETGFGTNAYSIDDPKEPVRVEPMNGAAQLEFLFETMAKLIVARAVPFDTFLEQEVERMVSGMDILILSAYVGEKMIAPIEELRRNGNAVDVFILEGDEVEESSMSSSSMEEAGVGA
ncbi:DUF58 domain-containing protein [Paenibacillus cremeus]|uniref:DUF58 domain-containing protein n=1 Tax=Paenibacillus cremeus TaxID=2163881 RepID=A0A559KEB8_9BACL|nr:DUF58 domain-containing protein [Paenibacillus cremeus]TVY10453.1 DUF58 domain-containing protein [Paenibacillus cremeus]